MKIQQLYQALLCASAIGVLQPATAEINRFEDPDIAGWGGWSRSEAGAVYASWDKMSPLVLDISNPTPDIGSFGLLRPPPHPLGADLRVVPFTAALTGSFNYYSHANVPDFDIAIFSNAAHQALIGGVTVALQVAVVGNDINDAAIRLNCVVQHADDDNNPKTNSFNDDIDATRTDTPISETGCINYAEKIILETGVSQGPSGELGVNNEYLYIWRLPSALSVYTFDISAQGPSFSLDALAIDIGAR